MTAIVMHICADNHIYTNADLKYFQNRAALNYKVRPILRKHQASVNKSQNFQPIPSLKCTCIKGNLYKEWSA